MHVYIYVCLSLFTWQVVCRPTNTCLDSDGTRLINGVSGEGVHTNNLESTDPGGDSSGLGDRNLKTEFSVGVFTQIILKVLILVGTFIW